MLNRVLKTSLQTARRSACYGGPALATHLKETFAQLQAPVDFEEHDINSENFCEKKFAEAVQAIRRSGSCIKGSITTHEEDLGQSRNQRLRKELDIYANVVHAKSFEGIDTRHKDVDIYLIRENTEGEYSGKEHETVPGVIESLKIMTDAKCRRIAHFAFQFAREKGRKKVTAIHKANIMKQGDGLFLRVATEVSKDYPDIEFSDMIVDNTCMQLVSNPWQFDVMLLPNLYGNIVGNVCCGLTGGSGLAAGSNYSCGLTKTKNTVGLFEPATRGCGKTSQDNTCNPTAFLMAGVKMLEYNNLDQHAGMIRSAIAKTITEDGLRTADVGGSCSTNDFMSKFYGNLGQIQWEAYEKEESQRS